MQVRSAGWDFRFGGRERTISLKQATRHGAMSAHTATSTLISLGEMVHARDAELR
jgi:hypothetical protein